MLKRALICCGISIALCVSGCAGRQDVPDPPVPPTVLPVSECAAPAPLVLDPLPEPPAGKPPVFDSREMNVEMKLREKDIRDYIAAMEAAIRCYEAQVTK